MYMRASGASEKIFVFSHLKTAIFFQCFVGTSETLSVQMTYLSAYMYRQIFKCTDKTPKKGIIWGGGGNFPPPLPPPPPSGYASASKTFEEKPKTSRTRGRGDIKTEENEASQMADEVDENVVTMEDKKERRMKHEPARRADGAHRPDEEWRGAPEE